MKDRPGLFNITHLMASYSHWGMFPHVLRWTFVGWPWHRFDLGEEQRFTLREDFE